MKRNVVTAIGHSQLNDKLKKIKDFNIVSDDLSTDEEVIELLEREKNIQFLIIFSKIIVHYKIDEFIEIVKKLQDEIYIIFFKEPDLKNDFLDSENIKIYSNTDIDLEELERSLQQELKKEIKKYSARIIGITGGAGVGKSTFSTVFAKNVENKKVLLIDFDLEENNVRTILKIRKKPKDSCDVKEKIINVTKNLDVLCHLDLHFKIKEQITFFQIQEMINELKNNYDLIIFDTSSRLNQEYTRKLLYNCDEILFLIEPNILGIKKAKNMLEVFENDWRISNEKIKLVSNKAGIYQIDKNIIEELFSPIKVIGKVEYNDVYNLLINKNIQKREIKKEYQKIYSKII